MIAVVDTCGAPLTGPRSRGDTCARPPHAKGKHRSAASLESAKKYQRRWYEANLEAVKERHRRHFQEMPEAQRERQRRWREKNSEAVKERERRWREENAEAVKERQRRWYEENSEIVKEKQRRWYEANREAVKERRLRYREENAEAVKEWNRRYREKNAEAVKERQRRWREANLEKDCQRQSRRRARKAGAEFPPSPYTRAEVLAKTHGRCWSCGKRVTLDTFHVDHVVPIAWGGPDTLWNVAPACSFCNLSRGAKIEGVELPDGPVSIPHLAAELLGEFDVA